MNYEEDSGSLHSNISRFRAIHVTLLLYQCREVDFHMNVGIYVPAVVTNEHLGLYVQL